MRPLPSTAPHTSMPRLPQQCVCATHHTPTTTYITPNTSRVSCKHVPYEIRVCNCSNFATCGPNAFAPSAPRLLSETTNTPHHQPCSSPNQTINITTPSTFITIQPLPSTAPHTSMSRAPNHVCATHHTHQPKPSSPTHHASATNTYNLNSEFATAAILPHVGSIPSRPRHQGNCLKQPTHHITHRARHPTKQSHHPPSQPSNHSHRPLHAHPCLVHPTMCVPHTKHTPTTTHSTPNTSRVSCKAYQTNSEFATATTLPHVSPMPSRPQHQGYCLKQPTHHITHCARHPTKQTTSLHRPT